MSIQLLSPETPEGATFLAAVLSHEYYILGYMPEQPLRMEHQLRTWVNISYEIFSSYEAVKDMIANTYPHRKLARLSSRAARSASRSLNILPKPEKAFAYEVVHAANVLFEENRVDVNIEALLVIAPTLISSNQVLPTNPEFEERVKATAKSLYSNVLNVLKAGQS